jgi:cytochrome c553
MASVGRWFARGLIGIAALVALAAGAIYGVSEYELRRAHPVAPEPALAIAHDPETIERGRHLATAVSACVLCHADDLGGVIVTDAGPVGKIVGANLTSGSGGVGAGRSAEEWERAIRHGVRKDGSSLVVMPSEAFVALSDRDLGAIVAFLEQLQPVDRALPKSHFRPLGRALLTLGKFDVLVADKVEAGEHRRDVAIGATPEYGGYLAHIAGCHGCHGHRLEGAQVLGPPGTPPSSNLTPAGLAGWSEADFTRALREGHRPDGRELNEFMPWRIFRRMTDDELHALWLYLESVPPVTASRG